jgi:hypothetical protein
MRDKINKYSKIASIALVFVIASAIVIVFTLKHSPGDTDLTARLLSKGFLNTRAETQLSALHMNTHEALIIFALFIIMAIISIIVRKKINYK